ncbi:MAG TPA: adenylate/guanylate cyclase domain-containing protein, partial [Tepidisphaeraceae bacterium]|nr:adenylate/guanylate cyclase domain-containing protein [Tepidisphaeraceae bacterium]
AEAILRRGAQLHVILPINVEEFLEQSVRQCGDDSWERRFHAIRARATSERVFGDDYFHVSGTPFQMGVLLIDGYAAMLAQSLGSGTHSCLTVWDGQAGDGLGGAASFAGHCVEMGHDTTAIDPMTGKSMPVGMEARQAALKHSWRVLHIGETRLEHRLGAFLFADAQGFGGLRETQIPAFARIVLGSIRSAIAALPQPPRVVNTWGDGFFVVTDFPEQAALLAMSLLGQANKVNWRAEGLPGRITFRIGLHAGPAFVTECDPVTQRANAYGRDVSLAARIEPIVEPGKAWASHAFAVLHFATSPQRRAFRDLGEHDLPKDAGRMLMYEVGAITAS